jgi:hypothetical protein
LDGTTFPGAAGQLRWESAGDKRRAAGKSLLRNSNGEIVAVADFHCYVGALGEHWMLVWYTEEEGKGAALRRGVRFRVFDAHDLRPITDLPAVYAKLGAQSRFHARPAELASLALSTALEDGIHTVVLPAALQEAGELLVLADSTADGRRSNHYDEMHLRLWMLDTAGGRLEIIPQDWFNAGRYDFMYQWVTRMARLPETGAVVGEGIRLGVFRLDGSKRQIAEWLVEDVAYRPE